MHKRTIERETWSEESVSEDTKLIVASWESKEQVPTPLYDVQDTLPNPPTRSEIFRCHLFPSALIITHFSSLTWLSSSPLTSINPTPTACPRNRTPPPPPSLPIHRHQDSWALLSAFWSANLFPLIASSGFSTITRLLKKDGHGGWWDEASALASLHNKLFHVDLQKLSDKFQGFITKCLYSLLKQNRQPFKIW